MGSTGPGANFCNANNICECQVAAGGNSYAECCSTECSTNGCGGCATGCKSMHFHNPSIAFPFRCHYETKPLLSSFVFTFTVDYCYDSCGYLYCVPEDF